MGTLRISRRAFLRSASLGAAFMLGGNLDLLRKGPASLFNPATPSKAYTPDVEIGLTPTRKWMSVLPGPQTQVWSYNGQIFSGSGVTVQAVPGSYLGPIIRVPSGTKLRIFFYNDLAEKSILHPHGLRLPEDCDGQPMQAIDPGQTKVYDFPIIDRAGPYWFHPHPMGRTAEQVVMGLAGLMYVTDPAEQKAVPGAASGENDIPVVIQDRLFESHNQFLYQPNMMWGYLGDRILVNGQPEASMTLEPRAYRLRFLNGSNARTYKLAWSNAMPLTVIGTDGGLLPAVETRSYVMLMPGERVDVWADFSQLAGQNVVLRSLEFQAGGMMVGGMSGGMNMGMGMGMTPARSSGAGVGGMGMGMMGGMGMGAALPNGSAFDILRLTIGQQAASHPTLGPLPALETRFTSSNVPNAANPRTFTLSMQMMMNWTINGRVYEPDAVAEDEKVNVGETMAWEWVNASPIPHPMHVHNARFQVLERNTDSVPASYASVNQGFVDSGWKDTVLVWPGERVKIAMTFGPDTGMYMYHCHILEHEDMTMMRNFVIQGSTQMGM